MARLHTHNRRHRQRYGRHTQLEQRMASHDDGAAVIARVRAAGFPDRLCVGLAYLGGGCGTAQLQAIYTLPHGRYAFVMANGVTFSRSKHWRAER